MIPKKITIPLFGVLVLMSSCLDQDRNFYREIPQEAYFDFKLSQNVKLTIDYGFSSKDDYIILFDLYDQDPMIETDGTIGKREGLEPLFRAATDGSGKFAGEVTIPSALSEVWLYSEYLGTISPVKLNIENQNASFNQKNYTETLQGKTRSSRAETSNKHKYPDEWLVLGDWDQYGTPNYLEDELASPPASTLYSILDTYTAIDSKWIKTRYPQFFDGTMSSDIKIIKSTKVSLAFINSTAGWNNVVGYFTYPTDQKPSSPKEIKRIMVFPNASPMAKNSGGKRGALLCGHQVALKYWDGKQFHDEFPAGISIGWWLEGMGFEPNAELKYTNFGRYSLSQLNADKKQRAVSLKDKHSDQIVAIGFEDNIDMKYNDASFYLSIEKKGAIDTNTPELPEVDLPANENNSTQYQGILAFEDLWPSMGDYDMNDAIISYKSTVYKTIIGNFVYKTIDEFTILHNGATLKNGFGYQLRELLPEDIRNIKITGKGASKYMEEQMLEPGQSHPTILLFDDLGEVLDQKYTITTLLNDVNYSKVTPPYNPFIIGSADKERGREIHLSKFPPTDKANYSFFGTSFDGSRPQENLFYVASHFWNQYPFALNLPIAMDFTVLKERVNIDLLFPQFRTWVTSSGTKNKDWYKYPKK